LVFGRRGRKEEREAAREEERRALFAELAKRPDTVCPFLGMADARTKYTDGVDDKHRCYAFGDPAELSAEQQTKVCLQRGYGNCPRYLRGVLVIPTEELEALRRPPPPIQPRPPAAAAEPRRKRRGIPAAAIFTALVLLIAVAGIGGAAFWYLSNRAPSSAQSATLPAGTALKAELVSLSPPAGNKQNLHATAAIGTTQAVANTTLVYVFDLSASTLSGDGCGGDANHDGTADTPLDCEIAAAAALNAQAISKGTVGEVGLIGFAAGATVADLANADRTQALVAPGADTDGDGTPDVVQAMESAFSGGRTDPVGFSTFSKGTTENTSTDFSSGIQAVCDVLADTVNPNRLVVFLSDGANRGGDPVSSVPPCVPPAVFQTFAVGAQASCTQESELGNLQGVADLTGGTCTSVSDLTTLPDILGKVVLPQITRVELTVDGGEPVDITGTASPPLPIAGPAQIQIDHGIAALGSGSHELCLTVFASDAGGTGSVKSCSSAKPDGGPLTAN
jgi:trimeric autotransporter adhesin